MILVVAIATTSSCSNDDPKKLVLRHAEHVLVLLLMDLFIQSRISQTVWLRVNVQGTIARGMQSSRYGQNALSGIQIPWRIEQAGVELEKSWKDSRAHGWRQKIVSELLPDLSWRKRSPGRSVVQRKVPNLAYNSNCWKIFRKEKCFHHHSLEKNMMGSPCFTATASGVGWSLCMFPPMCRHFLQVPLLWQRWILTKMPLRKKCNFNSTLQRSLRWIEKYEPLTKNKMVPLVTRWQSVWLQLWWDSWATVPYLGDFAAE